MSSEADGDGGYVHTPGADSESDTEGSPGGGDPDQEGADRAGHDPESQATGPDGFGRKGWALTGVLLTCVLVIPGVIYAYPYVAGSFGLTFFGTYLVLPLIPAVLLGLVAVWSMSAATAGE